MIELVLALMAVKYRDGFSAPDTPAAPDPDCDVDGPYGGLFIDDIPEPVERKRPDLRIVK